MRKILIIHFLFLAGSCIAWANSDHLQNLKTKYPFGLLGDDYGILTENDLAENTCDGRVEAVSSNNMAYPYWQCFSTKDASFECDGTEYDKDEKSIMVILAIAIHGTKTSDEYLTRRAIPISNCRSFRKDWKRITAKQKFFCISGPVISYQRIESEEKKNTWIFDKFKTFKGCISYFHGDCDLQYKIKHGCKLSKMESPEKSR